MTRSESRDDHFWAALGDVQAGMLGAEGARFVPMSHYPDAETQTIWFLTAKGTDLVAAIGDGAPVTYLIADGGGKLYARIEGLARVTLDRVKLDEIWNPVADTFYDGGKDDADLAMVRVDLTEAEVWHTPGGVKFMFELAKATLTGAEPDMGDTYSLKFADAA